MVHWLYMIIPREVVLRGLAAGFATALLWLHDERSGEICKPAAKKPNAG